MGSPKRFTVQADTMMRVFLFVLALFGATAFAPGAAPLKLAAASSSTRAVNAEMMPKFLKDLFPDMDKPDNPLAGIAKMFGMEKEDEPAPEPEPAPEEAPAEV